jgi:hypothetical protein
VCQFDAARRPPRGGRDVPEQPNTQGSQQADQRGTRHRNHQTYLQNLTHTTAEVERVRAWRKAHPGYWRRLRRALQTVMKPQPNEAHADGPGLSPDALQTVLLSQPAVLVGIISSLAGTALQTDIAEHVQRLHLRGEQILHPKRIMKGAEDDRKDVVETGAFA